MADIQYKILNNMAIVPTRGSEEAAGMDLYAAIPHTLFIKPHTTEKVDTGLSFEFPNGTFGMIAARSGIATKRGLRPANAIGVVDSDYRGPVIVALHNDTDEIQYVEPGERIAQLILMPYIPMNLIPADELSETERGDGSFGHSGRM